MSKRTRRTTELLRHLVRMQQAGLPWVDALEMWRQSCTDAREQARVQQLIRRLRAGQSLSEALIRGKWVAGPLAALSRAGEASGSWATHLAQWLDQTERQNRLMRQVRGALLYPGVVLALAFAVISGVLTWVLPVFEGLYAQLGGDLPWPTRSLMQTRLWLTDWGGWLGVMLAMMGLAWVTGLRHRNGRLALERVLWRPPWFGRWRQMHAEAQWCAVLAQLRLAGMDWAEALNLAGAAVSSPIVTQVSTELVSGLARGQGLGQAMERCNSLWRGRCGRLVFSPTLVNWVHSGEASGTLPDLLLTWSALQSETLSEQWASATRMLEPALMGVLGLLMGWLVLAMYLPVLQMGQLL
jgi:type II secretory pathway component PulF